MRNNKIVVVIIGLTLFLSKTVGAQENRLTPKPVNSAAIYEKLEKLNFLGTALFIAAHPDDENTRLISWLANDRKARTAYLSLTRGDGGQNLIGPQLREQLGLIRTQELLEARNIDGGQQFFTRANDFGYSKHPDETLEIWDQDAVLEDMIRIIRTFKPDVIINRFDHRSAGTTHGHHTSSAILSMTAFEKANDKTAYPNALQNIQPWQPSRLFFNTSWWFYGSEEAFDKADKTNLFTLDAGTYFKHKGLSNGEIAALSRSEHQSQGFGSSGSRGSQTEYLEYLKGSFPSSKDDLFSGINTTWTRVGNGEQVNSALSQILKKYSFLNPENSIDDLLKLRVLIKNTNDEHWKAIKLAELDLVIKDILGNFIEMSTSERNAIAGNSFSANLEITNRSSMNLTYSVNNTDMITYPENTVTLKPNESKILKATIQVPNTINSSTPYWLQKPGSIGLYAVNDINNVTIPENLPEISALIQLHIGKEKLSIPTPLIYKRTDDVRGEVREPFYIVPAISIALENPVYIFGNDSAKAVSVNVESFEAIDQATISLQIPQNWIVSPQSMQINNLQKGIKQSITFIVTPPKNESVGTITATATFKDKIYDSQVITIDYNHIPDQQLINKATASIVKPSLINKAKKVAYINGAGDDVAQAIMAIGSEVDSFIPATLPANLNIYDAVVIGIRAANVHSDLPSIMNRIDQFVQNGGTLVMQYNTAERFTKGALGPLDITLSRKRVTDETAVVTFLNPNHKILNAPNKISSKDFENWVQERGLYFPEKWDSAYEPILGMNDKGEAQTTGSLIVAPRGKGHIIYTGLSLFRELPAGVPGAYRLLANLLSISK